VILLDTDVLIDVALDRTPHAGPAADLLTYLERRPRISFLAWHSLSNFHYVVSPSRGKDDAKDFLLDLTRFVSVAPTDTDALRYATTLSLPDFEDALQVAAANACGAVRIATRNVRHYRNSPIPARSPRDLLAELTEGRLLA
jgi:predicted nucleic acid-binding protein